MPDDADLQVDVIAREQPPRDGGPRAWVVLLGTAMAAAAVVGGVFGYQAWQDDDPDAAPATPAAAPPTVAPGDEPDQGTFLFRRTTADGIELRARLTENNMRGGVFMDVAPVATIAEGPEGLARPQGSPTTPPSLPIDAPPSVSVAAAAPRPIDPGIGGPAGAGDLPPECEIAGDLTAWAISDENVAQGGGPWMTVSPEELYPQLMWDGMANPDDPDAQSILGTLLQVPADVTMVRMRTAGGAFDEMEPVQGAAVLAVLLRAADAQDLMNGGMAGPRAGNAVQITAERADGSLLNASLLDAMNRPHPAWGPQCQPGMIIDEPPPETTVPLPDPGEQPADPDTARAEIQHNFSLLYGERDPAIDRSSYIDDNFAFAETSADVERNFPGASDAASVSIDEIVFVDPWTAMFRYDLDTPNADFRDQIGRARLLDGIWKITRGTLCQDMSHGGGMCPP